MADTRRGRNEIPVTGVWHGMRNVLFSLGVPTAILVTALLPAVLAEDHTPPGYEEHARRLKTQASHSSDLRPGFARVQDLRPVGGEDSPDAVEGTVRWVGPFGATMLEVRVTDRATESQLHQWRMVFVWGGLIAGLLIPPAVVVWQNTRT